MAMSPRPPGRTLGAVDSSPKHAVPRCAHARAFAAIVLAPGARLPASGPVSLLIPPPAYEATICPALIAARHYYVELAKRAARAAIALFGRHRDYALLPSGGRFDRRLCFADSRPRLPHQFSGAERSLAARAGAEHASRRPRHARFSRKRLPRRGPAGAITTQA